MRNDLCAEMGAKAGKSPPLFGIHFHQLSELAQAALDRGHAVTCVARGSSPAPKGTTFISADRDDDDGLASVASRSWAAVIDVSRQPGQVRRAVRRVAAID